MWRLLVVYAIVFVLLIVALTFTVSTLFKAIDESGGLKTVIERVWMGKNE